jgi:integration host factor subunit beta
LTKKEMVREIAAELKIDQILTKRIVQCCLDGILHVIQDQGRIELRNFGVFEMKQRAPRKARNPKTNQEVHVPAKRILTFHAGKNVAKKLLKAPIPDPRDGGGEDDI